jgi:hypothetical protein
MLEGPTFVICTLYYTHLLYVGRADLRHLLAPQPQLCIPTLEFARIRIPLIVLAALTLADISVTFTSSGETRAGLCLTSASLALAAGELVDASFRAAAMLAAEMASLDAVAVCLVVARAFVCARDEILQDFHLVDSA